MIRWSVLTAGAVVVIGTAFVTARSIPPKPLIGPPREEIKAVGLGQKTGYFNMAAVMREYRRAINQVKDLNEDRIRLAAPLVAWKAKQTKVQQDMQTETVAERKEELGRDLVQLARKIEDKDREINKLLNDRATHIISGLYDEIRAEVVEMAREHGLVAVLAYPDAVTPEELSSPQVKELKLKPPAAQPFYLDPSVEYTDEVIQRLNAKFAPAHGQK